MIEPAERQNIVDEIRQQFAKRNAEEGATDVVGHGTRLFNFLLTEKGVATALLVLLLVFTLVIGYLSIKGLRADNAANTKLLNALVFQEKELTERVDSALALIAQRERELEIRRLSERYRNPYDPRRQESDNGH